MGEMDNYREDIALALRKQTELITRQVLLEIITMACNCDDFDQFKKVLYSRALGYMKEFEDQGVLKPGTTEKVAKGEHIDDDDIIPPSGTKA